jgi:hypothetical protein
MRSDPITRQSFIFIGVAISWLAFANGCGAAGGEPSSGESQRSTNAPSRSRLWAAAPTRACLIELPAAVAYRTGHLPKKGLLLLPGAIERDRVSSDIPIDLFHFPEDNLVNVLLVRFFHSSGSAHKVYQTLPRLFHIGKEQAKKLFELRRNVIIEAQKPIAPKIEALVSGCFRTSLMPVLGG